MIMMIMIYKSGHAVWLR